MKKLVPLLMVLLVLLLASGMTLAKPKMRDTSYWEHVWTDPATGNQYAVDGNNVFFESWSEQLFFPLRIYDAAQKRWDIYLTTYFGSPGLEAFHYIRYWGNTKEMTWKSAIRETWNEIHTNAGKYAPSESVNYKGKGVPQLEEWQVIVVDWVTDFVHLETERVQFLETGTFTPKLAHYPYR